METLSMFDMLRQAVWVIILASMPVLAVAMLVGVLLGVLQTATSIQEHTLAFVPKIVAIFAALVFFGPFMFGQVGDFTVFVLKELHRFVQ